MNRITSAVVGAILLSVCVESALAQTLSTRKARVDYLLADNATAPNFDYRLYLKNITDTAGVPVANLCSATPGANFAFVNATDRNYRSMVTAITLAKALDAPVTVTVETFPYGTSTYCHLLDIWY
jgi:hypothetical protein